MLPWHNSSMKTIALLSQKGGTGKTTLALNLAGAAEAAGEQVVIVDLDPQSSAMTWYDLRQTVRGPDTPVVLSAQASRLAEVLAAAAAHGATLCILDTAAHSSEVGLKAAKVADLILIPCRASLPDLKAITFTVDLVELAKKPALFVLNCVRPGDRSLPDDAEEGLAVYGVPVASQRICQRAPFVHSLIAGKTVEEFEPDGPAAQEIRALLALACQHPAMLPCSQVANPASCQAVTV
jgi:chromosome partitioning protein